MNEQKHDHSKNIWEKQTPPKPTNQGGEHMSEDWLIVNFGILALIVVIGVVVLWKVLQQKKSGYPMKDERTQKINGKASYYALLIGQYFIIALLGVIIVRDFLGLPELEAGYPLIASALVLSLSYIVLRVYFDRKGDL